MECVFSVNTTKVNNELVTHQTIIRDLLTFADAQSVKVPQDNDTTIVSIQAYDKETLTPIFTIERDISSSQWKLKNEESYINREMLKHSDILHSVALIRVDLPIEIVTLYTGLDIRAAASIASAIDLGINTKFNQLHFVGIGKEGINQFLYKNIGDKDWVEIFSYKE